MDENLYPFSTDPIGVQYRFESVSDDRIVEKVARLTEMSLPDVYNAALLDILDDSSESDVSVTDNGDLRTVLATVMQIIDNFLTRFLQKCCYVQRGR